MNLKHFIKLFRVAPSLSDKNIISLLTSGLQRAHSKDTLLAYVENQNCSFGVNNLRIQATSCEHLLLIMLNTTGFDKTPNLKWVFVYSCILNIKYELYKVEKNSVCSIL